MKVENFKMYHYHTKNEYDNLWKKGNVIEIDDKFKSVLIKRIEQSTTYYTKDKKHDELFSSLRYNINRLKDPKFIEELANLSKNGIVDSAENLSDYFDMILGIFKNYLIRDREYILECVRQKYYPELPSRYHSIWICDERSKNHWNKYLCRDKVLYEVSLTGRLFKSSDSFIPDYRQELYVMEELAHRYWNPKFETEKQEDEAEYLFQGNVKILKRINKRSTR